MHIAIILGRIHGVAKAPLPSAWECPEPQRVVLSSPVGRQDYEEMDHEPHEPHERVLFAEEVFQIQGAIFDVNREMGAGFLEAVYQECLALEFTARGIPFVASRPLALSYKGRLLRQSYQPDFICFESVIVELKAVRELTPEHRAQVLNYLKATGLRLGLLVNFGSTPKARVERLVL